MIGLSIISFSEFDVILFNKKKRIKHRKSKKYKVKN